MTTTAYRAAIDAHDPPALGAACTPDVVFRSPISNSAHFEGRAALESLYRTVHAVYDQRDCVAEHRDGDTVFLLFRARVGRQELDEVQVLRLNEEDLVREITMYVRPLPGLTRLTAALAPRLAAPHGRWRALLLAGMLRPLAFITRAGDRTGARLAKAGS